MIPWMVVCHIDPGAKEESLTLFASTGSMVCHCIPQGAPYESALMSHCAKVHVGQRWQRGEEEVLFIQCVLPIRTLGTSRIGHDIEVPSFLAHDISMCPQTKGWPEGSCPQMTTPRSTPAELLSDLSSLPVPFSHQSGLDGAIGFDRSFGLSEPRCLVRELPEKLGCFLSNRTMCLLTSQGWSEPLGPQS